MLVLYHFYNENLGAALSQYSQFSADYHEVGRRVRRIIQPHARIPLYRAGRHHYRNLTQLTIACINNQPHLVDSLITRLGADTSIKCDRKNRWENDQLTRSKTGNQAETYVLPTGMLR